MIHAFAIDPQLAATWGRREAFRYIHDKFGLGTPRALLELPTFSKWKRQVYDAAMALALSPEDMKRIEEVFRLFSEHKCRRADSKYDGLAAWLENAEKEYARRPFRAVLATQNPRNRAEVLVADQLDAGSPAWACKAGPSPPRTPEGLAAALSAMLANCSQLHLIDPHFNPETTRYRKVLNAFVDAATYGGVSPQIIRVHCAQKSELRLFEQDAANLARHLPKSALVEFVRLNQKFGGEKLHNRYVLTDIGGVAFGVGLDAGNTGETDDLFLLTRAQYELRWAQYVGTDSAFVLADKPKSVQGTR